MHWIPDPTPMQEDQTKFQKFEQLYGQQTEEVFRPTHKDDLDEQTKPLLVKEKVQGSIKCSRCEKPRLVFADKKIWRKDKISIELQIEVK